MIIGRSTEIHSTCLSCTLNTIAAVSAVVRITLSLHPGLSDSAV